jgi:hypothetical protein
MFNRQEGACVDIKALRKPISGQIWPATDACVADVAEILAKGVIRLLGPEKELDVARDKSVCPDVLNDAEDTDE